MVNSEQAMASGLGDRGCGAGLLYVAADRDLWNIRRICGTVCLRRCAFFAPRGNIREVFLCPPDLKKKNRRRANELR